MGATRADGATECSHSTTHRWLSHNTLISGLVGDRLPDDGDAAGIVRVLHLRDPLVRPRLDELAQRFAGREVLQYLLIDDDIHGAACGHWRIKAHDVADVLIDDACVGWRDEVLEAVRRRYPPPEQQVLACNGEPL